MTIEEIKDKVAKEHEYDDWDDIIQALIYGDIMQHEFIEFENQAMHRLAEIVAIKQREECASSVVDYTNSKGFDLKLLDMSVLNTPLASDKYKP